MKKKEGGGGHWPPTFISIGLKDKKKRQKMSDKRIK